MTEQDPNTNQPADIREIIRREVMRRAAEIRLNSSPGLCDELSSGGGSRFDLSSIMPAVSAAETEAASVTEVSPFDGLTGPRRYVARIAGRLVLYLSRFLVSRQPIFNQNIVRALQSLMNELGNASALQQREQVLICEKVDRRMQDLARELWGVKDVIKQAEVVDPASMASFYAAFEDKFRGSREIIKKRAEVYMPLVRQLQTPVQALPILDLGCGRGEWLELLKENGRPAYGIDINPLKLKDCREGGLEVVEAEALAHLRSLPDNSLAGITGLHLIEHLPFSSIFCLMDEARRVLAPGGILILETPNPENLIVGLCNFYIDPSHLRPLPPPTMQFMAEFKEFAGVSILRLSEHRTEQFPVSMDPLMQQLMGTAPDYAVIGYKR